MAKVVFKNGEKIIISKEESEMIRDYLTSATREKVWIETSGLRDVLIRIDSISYVTS